MEIQEIKTDRTVRQEVPGVREEGQTKQIPKIYIITNLVTSQESEQSPDYINLKLLFLGIDGKGGQGGDGGNGGNGADIIFIGSESALDVLSYSIILNTGGGSGTLGRPGALGLPGRGGAAGSGSTFCHGGDRGRDGGSPIPTNEGTGQLGKDGEKGKVDRYKILELQGIIF